MFTADDRVAFRLSRVVHMHGIGFGAGGLDRVLVLRSLRAKARRLSIEMMLCVPLEYECPDAIFPPILGLPM